MAKLTITDVACQKEHEPRLARSGEYYEIPEGAALGRLVI